MGWWRDLTGGFGPVGKTLIGLLVVVGVVVVLPIALILGVDRFLDMCRTCVNVLGDLVIAVVADRWSGGRK